MIEMIQRPRIETEELSNDNTYGRFMVEPLERGFGTTLGNSLRRVLLSSRSRSTASYTSSPPFRVLRKMSPKSF